MNKLITLTILSMVSMGLFAKETKEQKFWQWFENNQSTIFEFESNQESVFDSISENLNSYQEDLMFEISHVHDGKREFIISADGISDLFPAVEALKNSAPKFENWTIISFRPRMNDYASFKLNYAGKELDPSKVWVYTRVKNGKFDLIVYHPEYTDEEKNIFVSASYILLDMALGEYDVVKGIRYIDHQKLPENPEEIGLKPFSELRKIFDNFKSQHKDG